MSSRRPSCDCRRHAKADIQAFPRILWTSTTLALIIESTPKNPCRSHHQPLPTAHLKAAETCRGRVAFLIQIKSETVSHAGQTRKCLFLIQVKPENVSHSGQTWKYLFFISGQTWKCLFLIQVKPENVCFSFKSNLKLFVFHSGQTWNCFCFCFVFPLFFLIHPGQS